MGSGRCGAGVRRKSTLGGKKFYRDAGRASIATSVFRLLSLSLRSAYIG